MKKHEFAYFEYFRYWCSQATKKILYRPDREAVYMELYGHLEDRFEAYISDGLSTKEAMEKALTYEGLSLRFSHHSKTTCHTLRVALQNKTDCAKKPTHTILQP